MSFIGWVTKKPRTLSQNAFQKCKSACSCSVSSLCTVSPHQTTLSSISLIPCWQFVIARLCLLLPTWRWDIASFFWAGCTPIWVRPNYSVISGCIFTQGNCMDPNLNFCTTESSPDCPTLGGISYNFSTMHKTKHVFGSLQQCIRGIWRWRIVKLKMWIAWK